MWLKNMRDEIEVTAEEATRDQDKKHKGKEMKSPTPTESGPS